MDYLQYVADKIGCQFSCKVKVKNDVIIVEGQREREVCFFYNSLREELERGFGISLITTCGMIVRSKLMGRTRLKLNKN